MSKKGHSHTPNVVPAQSNYSGFVSKRKDKDTSARDDLSIAPSEVSVFSKKPESVHPSTTKPVAAMPEDIDDMVEGMRDVTTEIDYSKKTASRHIVSQKNDDKSKLRARLLRNLDCVRAGKQILASEKSLVSQSIASTNARLDRARAKRSMVFEMDQVLEEEEKVLACEVCETVIDNEFDQGLNEKISM